MAVAGVLEILITTKDEVSAGLSKAESNVKKSGDKLSAWTIAKGQMLGRFFEKAVSSTANFAKKTVKSAISSYANYEQLVGGMDTLFKSSSQKMQDYASKAYMNVGVSANQYMETVTSFSAALIQGLGGDTSKAADVANMAMIDMADNVNKMGSSMQSIQNAYQGFAKQNYTMLDNLKLGYGGTKTEMERLLTDAGKLANKTFDIKKLSDVYEAIHTIQQEMGIAGTTQKEAMETVSGSLNAAKSAWQDVLVAIGKGKDIKKTIKQFGETARVALKNLRPVFKNAVSGIFSAFKELLPEVGGMLDDLINEFKNSDSPVLEAVGKSIEFVKNMIEGLSSLINDFPGTIEKLKVSEDPFAQLLGGGLEFLYNTLKWINNNVGLEGAIKGIVGAFAGIEAIKVSSSLLSFINKLSALGNAKNVKTLVDLFQNGFNGGTPNAPGTGGTDGIGGAGASAGAGAGAGAAAAGKSSGLTRIWTKVKGFASGAATMAGNALAGLAFFGLPIAGIVDTILKTNEMWEKGNEEAQRRLAEAQKFKKDFVDKQTDEGLTEAWDIFADYFSSLYGDNTQSVTEENNRIIDLAKRWKNYYENDTEDKMMDSINNLLLEDNDLWEGFSSVMDLLNKKGEGSYTDEEREQIDTTLSAFKEALDAKIAEEASKVSLEPDDSAIKSTLSKGYSTSVSLNPSAGSIWKAFFGQAKGNWYVPYDNYPSLLHRGEMVLSKSQARQLRDGDGGGSDVNGIINNAVEKAMSKVYVMLNGDKVGDLTTKRIKKNINASSYNKLRALGG